MKKLKLNRLVSKVLLLVLCFGLALPFFACRKKDNLDTLSKDLTNYEIQVNLNTETKTAHCFETVDYINSTDTILKQVKFHLYPQYFKEGATDYVVGSTKMNEAYPNGMSYAKFEILRLKVAEADKPVVFEGEHNGILNVELDASLMPTERVKIGIEFEFTLPNCCHRFGYGENTINLANFYPIACVYSNGSFSTNPYHANGDPFYSDMANYNVTIITDDSYKIASTGEKLEEKLEYSNKKQTFSAKMVRDYACVLSNRFEVKSAKVGETNIEYFYFDDENADKSLQAGVDSIKTFSNLFGDYPYHTFSIVKTDFIHGGMEYPNLVMISSSIDNIDDYMNVIIHETAHQWWYGMVGNDEYTHPWLDESLTEFSTLLFYDNNEGYNLSHKGMADACKSNYTLFISVYQDVLGNIDTSMRAVNEYATEPEYTYCIYVKGVLMYDSLYQLLGEKKFISCLKAYFADRKFKNATPEDLIFCFENASGVELKNFFDSWLSGKVIIR